MRSLALLPWTSMLTSVLLVGCTRDNPAFDGCPALECFADESGTAGDGDGDANPGDGDGEPGDGDGEPGDGDGAPGDGDGDGDGEAGDGDGDGDGDGEPNMLPACPEVALLELPVVKDTFLVAAPEENANCIVGWDFEAWMAIPGNSQMPCDVLDFGGAAHHWVCSGDGCSSMWLGRFNVGGYADQAPKVIKAQMVLASKIDNAEPNQVTVHSLDVDLSVFGNCGDWNAGSGWGDPVTDCKTTWAHAAYPLPWELDVNNQALLGTAELPVGEGLDYELVVPISANVAQDWLAGNQMHVGLLARSQAFTPTEMIVHAQESSTPPVLVVEVCSDL